MTADTKMMAVVLEARMLANHCRELEAVEIRHAHVDEDQCDFVLEQALECLARRRRLEQVFADLRQDGLVAQQLGLLIVDQQNVHLVRMRLSCGHGALSDAATCAARRAIARR